MPVTIDGSVGILSPDFEPNGSTVPTNGLYLPTTNTIAWATNSTGRLRLDASGNLGLGVTPSAWDSSILTAFQVRSASLSSVPSGGNDAYFSSNAFYNASWKYITSTFATQYRQSNGTHAWYNAPSGTAGNAITFTQAMTLDASANLGIGLTSPGTRLDVKGRVRSSIGTGTGAGGAAYAFYEFGTSSTASENWHIGTEGDGSFRFYQNGFGAGVVRGMFDSIGRLLVGVTTNTAAGVTSILQVNSEIIARGSSGGMFWENRSGGVSTTSNWYGLYSPTNIIYFWNGSANIASINAGSGVYTALSDRNKKKDFEESNIGLDAVLKLKPTLFRMKDASVDSPKELGFIAQDVKDIIPQAYVEQSANDASGNESTYIGLNDRPIIAAIVKAIQELTQRLEALEAK